MNIFVDKKAEIIVNIYLYENQNKLFCWTKNNQKNKPEDINESSTGVKAFTLVFRLPNYRDTVGSVDSGLELSPSGGIKISSGAVSFDRFTKLLKSWDFVNEDGIVPINSESIGDLEPKIAKCIVEDLEQQISD